MVTSSLINRLSQAIDQIEKRTQQKPWKVVRVRRGWQEHGDVAMDRHLAAHPEDRDADVAIFHFCDDPLADEGQVAAASAPASKKP
jgi:hypothetical protein